MTFFNKLHGSSQGVNHDNLKLSVQECLGLEGTRHYFPPAVLIPYLRSLREIEFDQLDEALGYMRVGMNVVGTITKRRDKGKRAYSYLPFLQVKGSAGVKVIMESGMEKFIFDYMGGKFIPDFTLEELADAALNN